MSKQEQEPQITSEGHNLIGELINHLAGGKSLSAASQKRWLACLLSLYNAKSQDQAAERLFKSLNLIYKTGRPEGDIEGFLYEIEYFSLKLGSKDKSFAKYADEFFKEVGSIRNKYYRHVRKDPEWAGRIRNAAQRDFEEGKPFQRTYPTGIKLMFVSKQK